MIIDKDGNTTIITQGATPLKEVISNLNSKYDSLKNNNIVVNLTTLETVTLQDILEFLQLSNTHRKSKHSFVIVSDKVNLDEMPDEIVVVPTLHEANDIIDMEDMERDLGF